MAEQTTPHVRFEYDPEFNGGNYSGVGRFLLVPLSEVDALGAEAAFEARSGLPASCLVHHTVDELYDAEGTLMEPDAFSP